MDGLGRPVIRPLSEPILTKFVMAYGITKSQWVNTFRHSRCLTHWGRDKMATIFQTTFSNIFSWMKMHELRLRFHWSLFLRVQMTIFQHWFRSWLGADQATSHCLNQWWLVYWRIYVSSGLNELRTMQGFGTLAHWGFMHIDGLVQERRNSSALAMELRLSCTNPSIWHQLS